MIGMKRTEKICVGSGIWYVSWDQDRVRAGFPRCGLDKPLYICSFVKGNVPSCCQSFNRQQFSELWHCAHEKNVKLSIWKKQLSLISGPLHSIGSGISGRVLRTYYLTCPGRVFVPPQAVTGQQLDQNYFSVFQKRWLGNQPVLLNHIHGIDISVHSCIMQYMLKRMKALP